MEVTVTTLSQVKKKLAIRVGEEAVKSEIDRSLQKYRKKAKLKGFRPGKAPLAMIRALYYDQARQEAMEELLQRSYVEALTEQELSPLAMPEIENLSFGDDDDYLSYEAVIEIKPDFTIEGYRDLEIEPEPVEVVPEDVDEQLESLRQAYARFVSVEDRPSREGDTLVIDFVGRIDGEEFPGGAAEGYTVEIGAGTFIADLEKQLVALERGVTRDLEVVFPEDYHQQELAGKPAVFTVTVNEIKEKTLPEINDDFAAEVSGGALTSLEDLRQRLEETIAERKQELARQKAVDELLSRLREMVDFELPETLVENEKKAMIGNLRRRYLSQGLEEKMVEEMVNSSLERLAAEAVEAVKNSLILEKIAELEKVACTQGDMSRQLQRFITSSGQPPQVLREHFAGREGELESMLRHQVIIDKTIDLLLGGQKDAAPAAAGESTGDGGGETEAAAEKKNEDDS